MDTNQYSNILKALGTNNNTLSTQQQADNYAAFSKMMNEGVYIPDLVKRLDALETEVSDLRKSPAAAPIDADLFLVMESAVKDDPDVKNARQRMATEKTRVLTEICSKDTRFKEALDDYRREVNRAYINQKEQTSDRGGTSEVRDHQEGRVSDQKDVPGHEGP